MNITKQIAGYLMSRSLVLVSVETCTAGAIGSMMADQRGTSGCLDLGYVAHSAAALAALPGVNTQTIARHGLVSEAVARETAEGALARSAGRASVALASVGWLANEDHEPGVAVTHCLAWACSEGGRVHSAGETVRLSGRRSEIRRSIARIALLGLPQFVDGVFARE
ncbi:CinA family protein [Paraburkholderia sp. J8-2]|uniref:CinA family protein n=1 Tax=Paraburkholderia sp. J8-2 TaxID=2805440 RepID=UPI002AB6634A|nr:CinA family protein [Paraburkholderia sp. J8-2]